LIPADAVREDVKENPKTQIQVNFMDIFLVSIIY